MLCVCGCGAEVNSGRFLQGHGRKGHTHTQSTKYAISDTHIKYRTLTERINRVEEIRAYRIKHYVPITNAKSSFFLGVTIAEKILSKVFKDVVRMPYNNPGYDFICNHGKKIDVKSSATGDKSGIWQFIIKQNQIADYFLCIAFNSRDDLYNPVHLWLIPGNVINHLSGVTIRKGTVDKWKQYELSLDKLVAYCDNLKSCM